MFPRPAGRAEQRIPADPVPAGLSRTSVALPGGRSIAYRDEGEGPPVVLIHGTLTLLEDMWLALAASLLPRYRVIALDRPGHGASRRMRLVDASPWRQAEIIRDALEAIGIDRPIVAGHSYGGTVALCYGLAYPKSPFDNYGWASRLNNNPPMAMWIMASATSMRAS